MSARDSPMFDQVGEQFLRHAKMPQNLGRLDNANGKGTAVGQCGDSVDVSLRVEGGVIADIRFIPHGCLHTLVCASVMSELAKGRELEQALELEPENIVAALGGLPEDHMHCAGLALNTLVEAIADYYKTASK